MMTSEKTKGILSIATGCIAFFLLGGYVSKELSGVDIMFYKYIMALFFGVFFILTGINKLKK